MIITKPTLLLDLQKCRKNIYKMVAKAKKNDLIFRPHFKTHQSIQIGEIFRKAGVDKITVSSIGMAQYFADAGWEDITIAFPFNILEISEFEELAEKIDLNVLISSKASAEKLITLTNRKLNYFIEVDAGYHRSGLDAENLEQIENTISIFRNKHIFKGFLTHSGNTYQARSKEEILKIHKDTSTKMKALKDKFIDQYPNIIISTGDTPSCTLANDFDGIDEIRPGNFVFFDLMQYNLGVCKFDEIAVCAACPVVDINPARNQIVIYGGGVHFSKEYLLNNGNKNFGEVVNLTSSGWQRSEKLSWLTSLSQEHGIIQASDELMNKIAIGDIVGIIPVHSCMTANLMGSYKTFDDNSLDHK